MTDEILNNGDDGFTGEFVGLCLHVLCVREKIAFDDDTVLLTHDSTGVSLLHSPAPAVAVDDADDTLDELDIR